jgi:hypothetical protein
MRQNRVPQQQFAPVFPPFIRQHGGAPRLNRHRCATYLAHLAAFLALPAGLFGGKLLTPDLPNLALVFVFDYRLIAND